jgi:nucleotide-binding universal stress UspA family protein
MKDGGAGEEASAAKPSCDLRVFERVVCGVDETEASREAVRQALLLTPEHGRVLALAVFDVDFLVHAGWASTRLADRAEQDLERSIEQVRATSPRVETRLVKGRPVAGLLAAIGKERATLVSVGSHGIRRSAGIAIGSVATTMLHQAPCSVLIARAPVGSQPFPRSIVVGVDGSPQAVAALAAARELSERLEAPLTVVAAAGEKSVDLDAVRELGVAAEEDRGKPVPSLVERSKKADLLVVGSRGLHGLKALGSVSERVAHQAGCSVLVIR